MNGAAQPPTGTIALLFTDIAGSTQLARAAGSRWGELLAAHHQLIGTAIAAEGGWIDGTEGDAFFATFAEPAAGARAALAAQRALAVHPWPGDLERLEVRMGLHVGYVEREQLGYVGLEVHRAARIGAAAHGGQILLSAAAAQMSAAVLDTESLGVHRLKDFPQPEQLFCAVVDGRGAAAFPDPRTESVQATNLPAGQVHLVGREGDRSVVIEALMVERERAVTLTGRSGAGKTSLALAVAAELLASFPGGVWLVRLAGVAGAGGVMAEISVALGADTDPSEPPLDAVVRRLRERGRTLLVLDNCEHVLAAVPELQRLLDELSEVAILATSQAPLRLTDELCLPLDRLDDEAALALIERVVRRRSPAAGIGPRDRPVVLEIVALLDGLPLALELAAARLVLLSPQQLLTRLRRSMDVLSDTRSDRPERQRSLRATIDWTLGLLEPGPQALFARLGVFAGPVELEEIEAVCDGEGVDVLSDLFRLLEVAVLRRVEDGDGRVRFGLPEGLRAAAGERLAELAEAEHWRRRHAGRQLEIAWPLRYVFAPEDDYADAVLASPERERALAWSRRLDDACRDRIAAAHAMLCVEDGRLRDAASTIDELMARSPVDPHVRSTYLRAQMWLSLLAGDGNRAVAAGEESVAAAPDLETRAVTLGFLGVVRLVHGDLSGSRRDGEEAVRLADQAGLSELIRGAIILLAAQAHTVSGDLDRASEQIELGETLSERSGSNFAWRRWTARGDLAAQRGAWPEALAHYARSLEEAERRHHDQQAFFDIIGSAMALAAVRADTGAVEVFAVAAALGEEMGGANAEFGHIFDGSSIAAARSRLDPDARSAAEARGRALEPARRISRVCELNRAAATLGSSVQ